MASRRSSSLLLFLIDDLAGPNGIGNPGEVADVGDGVTVKNCQIGIEALFDLALLRGLEIQRRIRRQRSEHLAFRKRPVHEFVFERRVIELGEADIGPKQNDAAILRKCLELADAGIHQPRPQSGPARNLSQKEQASGSKRFPAP